MLSLKDGNLRLCGGKTKSQKAVTACFMYEEEGKWSSTFSLTHARYTSTITTLSDGSLWMAGGVSSEGSVSTVLDSSEVLTEKGKIYLNLFALMCHHCSLIITC